MKKIVFFLLILAPCFSFSQEWDHIYDDTNGYNNVVQSAFQAYDSGYYMYRYDDQDYFRYSKTNIDGELLWTRMMRYSVDDYFGRGWMTTDNNGNIYYSGHILFNAESIKTAIMKIDPCGELIWCHTLNIPGSWGHWGSQIHVLPNNDIVVHTKYAGQWTGQVPLEREQLMKFNENGDLLWINQIMPNNEHPDKWNVLLETCIPSEDGGFFLAGTVYMQDSVSGNNFLYPKGVIVKTDEFGEEEYISIIDYPDENIAMVFCFELETDSDLFITGYDYLSQEEPRPTPTICSIDKYTGELKTRSIQYLPDSIPTGLCHMIRKTNEGYMIVNPIAIPSTQKNMLQIELLEESFNGYDSVIFNKRVIIYDQSTTPCEDNSIIVSGLEWKNPYTSNKRKGMAMKINQDLSIDSVSNIQLNYDSLCPYTIESGDRVCDCFTAFYVGIENDKVITLQDLEGIQAYPNPASEFITFETKTISKNRMIRIYDLNGKFVSEISFPQRSTEVLCNTSGLIAGTYIARLFIEERETGSTKFIIQ